LGDRVSSDFAYFAHFARERIGSVGAGEGPREG
jgi:hypothetical protein